MTGKHEIDAILLAVAAVEEKIKDLSLLYSATPSHKCSFV
jgi:hypothetical protein